MQENIRPIFGCVKASGWVERYMIEDVNFGFYFQFDRIDPTVSQDCFKLKNRISSQKYNGKKCWWNGEHEGYWMDGLIQTAFFIDNDNLKNRVKDWVDDVVSSTDSERYIGIYADDIINGRYLHEGENGELWTQARALSCLLLYFEFTGDSSFLDVVTDSIEVTIRAYDEKNPFESKDQQGGVSHGVGYFEVLHTMYRLTGKRKYVRFTRKLYQDFCAMQVRDDDLQIRHLIKKSRPLFGHGAHIAEGLFILNWLKSESNRVRFDRATEGLDYKLRFHSTPSGALRCDENVRGRPGGADEKYEFCTMVETVISLLKIFEITGDVKLVDRIEFILFNAAMGAQLEDHSGLAYLSSDNRFVIDSKARGGREVTDVCHPAAACCALNGGRLMPYFLQSIWFKTEDNESIVIGAYGPSHIETQINNVDVSIAQNTFYPFEDRVAFQFETGDAVEFTLLLRKPHDSDLKLVRIPEKVQVSEKNGFIQILHKWSSGDSVHIEFDFRPIWRNENPLVESKRYYLQRGPLLFVRKIEEIRREGEKRGNTEFGVTEIYPKDEDDFKYGVMDLTAHEYEVSRTPPKDNPWKSSPVRIIHKLYDGQRSVNRELVPMGTTILRQAVFEKVES